MDAAVGERLAAMRSELGALSVQLEELGVRVAEWAARANAVHAALAEAAQSTPAVGSLASEVSPPTDEEPRPDAAPPASEATAPAEPPRRGRTPLFAGELPTGVPPEAASAPPEPTAAGAGPETAEDEALLASLEPELAKAVRVKRRLSGRRSVREILAELNAEQLGAKDDTARKTKRR